MSNVDPNEHFEEGAETPPQGVRTMAVVRWGLVVLMGFAALFSIGEYFDVWKGGLRALPAQGARYYCPMHPSVVQDHPGECPICSMTLVPREAAASASASASESESTRVPGLDPVTLTPERVQLIGMRTARAERERISSSIQTVGFVSANEELRAEITTRFAGWIETLGVAKTGQRVTRGDVLATIYSPEVLAAQHEFLSTRRWAVDPSASEKRGASVAEIRPSLLEDARRRLELLGISEDEIQELEQSGQPMRALKIRSPVGGDVIRKDVLVGSHVEAGATLFEVADLSAVWVLADVYEYDLARVRVGAIAALHLGAYPDKKFTGKIEFVYPTIDQETRSLRVRIAFSNKQRLLKPGMYGDIAIDVPADLALVIPTEALIDTGRIQYVFLALAGGRFEPRRVRAGHRSDLKVEVLEGLLEGDMVVTTSNFVIDSESRLHAAISGVRAEDLESNCDKDFDKRRWPDKWQQCRACEVQHRGMGTMEMDCKSAIPKPWR